MSNLPTPEAAHTAGPMQHMDYDEPGDKDFSGKRSLATMSGVKAEWRYGSKKRVVRHYVVSFGIGLVIGGVIGMIIGLAVRYS